MQTINFTQKLLRQRRFLSSLLPLLALFFGLGASQSAKAGVTGPAGSTIFIDQNSAPGINTSYTTATFRVANLGTYDINTGNLLLKGGAFSTNETADNIYTYAVTASYIQYEVYDDNIGSTGTFTKLPLTLVSGPDASGNRQFSLTTAQINLIRDAVVTAGGASPGTVYDINVRFGADYTRTKKIGGTRDFSSVLDNNGGFGYVAQFNVTGTPTPPSTVTISSPTVIVDQGNGGNSYQASAFNGKNLIDQKPGSTSTPAFDINTGQLLLKGGSITTTETGTSMVNGAFLDYVVYTPNYSSVITNGALQLTQNGVVSGGVRNFSLASGTTNIIDFVTNAATGYIISVSYHATYQNNGIGAPLRVDNNNNGPGYNATFEVKGINAAPTGFVGTQVLIDSDQVDPKTVNVTYDASANTTNPDFQGHDFGNFDINTGQLILNGGIATTQETLGDVVAAVRLFYRVYKNGALVPGDFTNVALQGGSTVSSTGIRTFSLSTAQQNVITGLSNSGIGTYTFEAYFEADIARANKTFVIRRDDNNNLFYRASLNTIGIPIVSYTWTGVVNDDWFNANNWNQNEVPTALTNVFIPDFGPSNPTPYPNINSEVSFTASNGVVANNVGKGPALARNLVLKGGSQALRSILRIIQGRLKVYGDFTNQFDSFIMRNNTTIEFAGGNQQISGGSGFSRVVVSGGGTKNLPGSMYVTEKFSFDQVNGGGIFTTDIAQPTRSFIELADRASNNNDNGAQLEGENEFSYVRGFMKTNRANVEANEATARTFGGLGIELLFTGANNPGDVLVTRNTAENYTPLNSRFSIRRIFGVRPSSPNTNNGGLHANMVFHYLDNETKNLGADGTGFIAEKNLTIFVSTNSGGSFSLVGRDGAVDESTNRVTRTGVRTFATFTLGDKDNPLPVRLTAFDAKRIGADAFVTWQTATELDSKGYDVQVSTNGKEFRTLASVPSASPNSVKLTSYSYTDTEKNKSGTRYYRLRQVDLDGKDAFFAPVAVSFDGKVAASTLIAYPNPFNGNDELHVALQSSTAGKGQLTITDMTGRTIQSKTVDVTTGITDFAVNNMTDLKSGLYLVKFTLPSGEVKNLKVMKQ